MKKLLLPLLGLVLVVLPNCGGLCCKKKCVKETCPTECSTECKEKRVSGPLSEKEVGWEKEDYS